MYKNIIIIILAIICLGLFAGRIVEKRQAAEREISVAEYGGLVALRDIIPAEQYKTVVLPVLQKAMADGKMTRREMEGLNVALKNMGSLVVEAAIKPRPQEAMIKAWEDFKKTAASMGGEIGRNMREAMDGVKIMMDEWNKPAPGKPQPGEPSASPAPSAPAIKPQPDAADIQAPSRI